MAYVIARVAKAAPQIVTITYAALLGMLALAGALAFGLGGRDVAAQLLQGSYESGQRNRAQVQQDLQAGRARAQDTTQRTTTTADGAVGARGA